VTLFELEAVGGPWGRRLARRRASFDAMPWDEPVGDASPAALAAARWVWTQSAFSEYASAAAFAEIASSLLAAGAPIDLSAAAGEFVVDEMLHAELCARLVSRLGGAVPLDVDLRRLVRPPEAEAPLLQAAELLVRTSCVGEALTVPLLKATRESSRSPLVRTVVSRIVRDESAHAELGPWFLDWAAPRLTSADRAHLGRVAGAAIDAFAPVLAGECSNTDDLGVLPCKTYDPVFARAVEKRVVAPLRARGIEVVRAQAELERR